MRFARASRPWSLIVSRRRSAGTPLRGSPSTRSAHELVLLLISVFPKTVRPLGTSIHLTRVSQSLRRMLSSIPTLSQADHHHALSRTARASTARPSSNLPGRLSQPLVSHTHIYPPALALRALVPFVVQTLSRRLRSTRRTL